RWFAAGVVDSAVVHPGADSGQRGVAGCTSGHACDRLSALAWQPDRTGDNPDTFCNCCWLENQRWRIIGF
nr:hypothetical protein [Tanacetum cinerariifolium]